MIHFQNFAIAKTFFIEFYYLTILISNASSAMKK